MAASSQATERGERAPPVGKDPSSIQQWIEEVESEEEEEEEEDDDDGSPQESEGDENPTEDEDEEDCAWDCCRCSSEAQEGDSVSIAIKGKANSARN
ncbi:hypothetical protein EJ05DRAFT_479518 [Pseudovirgaria hyperparasitica]|uniref:Uncharacterized protein n=1 Tax=Pseudovirgaria hyperparasitica TaxID=470096 RepID=A0A6A6VWK0_9PEZI|nr:uncharacterized protein EJ05DRAFT_479518 [Pseudovirgaria hyperparasitica]KAF2754545.1 hypothetical protein EJ05DRAFT_479518 [Pseudovirgaria hyperparasitica]